MSIYHHMCRPVDVFIDGSVSFLSLHHIKFSQRSPSVFLIFIYPMLTFLFFPVACASFLAILAQEVVLRLFVL